MAKKRYEELIKEREEVRGKIGTYFYLSAIGFCLVCIGLIAPAFLTAFQNQSAWTIIIGLLLLISVYPLYKNSLRRSEIDKEIKEDYKINIVKK